MPHYSIVTLVLWLFIYITSLPVRIVKLVQTCGMWDAERPHPVLYSNGRRMWVTVSSEIALLGFHTHRMDVCEQLKL